ncbi:MAG: YetF domain-containing protein [Cyanobacteria bacterium J06581_3]
MDYSISKSLFSDWANIAHTLVAGTLTYVGIIVWLRVSGKRTLSKWNSFDFVVTIAFGSILASVLLTKSTTFVQSMVGVGLLVALQFIITWLSVRSSVVQTLIKAEPHLLLFKGELRQATLKAQRVAEGEVLAAIRLSGYGSIESVDAVILETNGNFSVIENLDLSNASAMQDVKGFRQNAVNYTSVENCI